MNPAPLDQRLGLNDALGREVAVLASGAYGAGHHEAVLDGASLPAGVYLARLVVDADDGLRRVLARPVTLLR